MSGDAKGGCRGAHLDARAARIVICGLAGLFVAMALAIATAGVAEAKGASHGSHQSANASTLRGGNGNDRKGGRYLAPAMRKLPGKRKPPTLTLKSGRGD